MDGKRTSDVSYDAEAKRTKTGYEVVINGERYVDLALLVRTPPFAAHYVKHCKKSVTRLIEQEELTEEIVNVSRENVALGVLAHKTVYRPASDLRLAKKEGKMQMFIDRVQGMTAPPAPPLINDEDIRFFRDAFQQDHKVEMRGKRTLRGIFFKVKHVGQSIGTKTLGDDIQLKNAKAEEGEDYIWFLVDKHGERRRVLFVTFLGLMRIIMRSNLPGAAPLCMWVCETVFCIGFGTAKQKDALGRSLLTKETVDLLTKRCANKIACVYLLETTRQSPEDAKKVYKFGFSKNLGRRMGELTSKYGLEAAIDTLIILPLNLVSKAESNLKHILGANYTYEQEDDTELLLLSDRDRAVVRGAMRTVGETFYGETLVHTHQLQMLKQDHEFQLISAAKDHELQLVTATKDHELQLVTALKNFELVKKDYEILELKNEAQARRIKELESMLRRMNEPSP
ncbi:hypothetical protein Poli38472_014565 [Pythium oligandrum]|uniref:Uncharacterized protein n=1 Tax=Pythium oligandrum TaxID=41045 RepID=A0A8K1CNZ4_PYTOL|nr:hypothetical protein Poli38472_014565 [Pythium oligandrum]|eukprot:TMW66589.1 hypothetical protein Poli38472_014565 [Pythium oligandrum]